MKCVRLGGIEKVLCRERGGWSIYVTASNHVINFRPGKSVKSMEGDTKIVDDIAIKGNIAI